MDLIEKMISERKSQNMSQKMLANLVGVNRRTIAAWERGEYGMGIDNADKVFKALGISVTIGADSGRKQ